jgi:murein biosynthesis integral membrane protein MurJ
MMASIFLSRLTGVAREMVLAALAGAGTAVDAYRVAFILPEILNHILASGFLSVTFIPIFTHYLAAEREAESWSVFSLIMNVFGLGLAAAIGVACLFAPELVVLLAPGLPEGSVFDSAVRMTRIIIPAQFFFFSGGLFMAVQFARERFLIPALAPLIYNLGIILGGVLLGPRLGIEGFAWGVLGGAFLGNFAVQYFGARQIGMRWGVVSNLRHPDLKRYILLTLPLMVGLSMTFSTEIFMRFFGSFLPAGSIAFLSIASYNRYTRSSMLEVINQDYMRTAKAKGLKGRYVLVTHAFKNAALPIVTLLGIEIPFLLAGAVVTERIFAWPGMGRLFLDHLQRADGPVVMGIVVIVAVAVIVFQILADLAYAALDPRIRLD